MIGDADRTRAGDLLARLEAAGAARFAPPILLPAGTLLDLYGEDIRARAFVTHDPLRGEAMLRPDFTVPLVQAHMEAGAEPARYCYAGEVFRRQEEDETRPREYLQVGYEAFDADRAAAEAEVLALFLDVLAPWEPRPATGDLGLIRAAVAALDTTGARRAALLRHLWRPARFRRLLDRFAGRAPGPATDRAPNDAPVIGQRTPEEVEARLDALRADAAEPPIDGGQADALLSLLSMRGTMAEALRALPDAESLHARADALAARGLDPATLPFAPAEGRSAMEYYDGFTFTITANDRTVATGGRYDALTAALGGGRTIPAVGGVIRPGLLEGELLA
ncbi:ATP phosphoribosyltransferase regulatory subunit [Jannaschia sp. Os4]|uniref:ATP phosphoribosyltransferase regulatory subunit n=1 Tax=Jannaschia sp. Os4 TaxID=2807617 RepID=UPI00193A588C|nr:ATP phosphoribosyltransferase regulatory subunit [Jannaschia sp. Os4]